MRLDRVDVDDETLLYDSKGDATRGWNPQLPLTSSISSLDTEAGMSSQIRRTASTSG